MYIHIVKTPLIRCDSQPATPQHPTPSGSRCVHDDQVAERSGTRHEEGRCPKVGSPKNKQV